MTGTTGTTGTTGHLLDSGVVAIAEAVRSGRASALSVLEEAVRRVSAHEASLHCFQTLTLDAARSDAEQVDAAVAEGRDPGAMAGVPIALKDNLCTVGVPTTCSSKILEGWLPPYSATVVDRLRGAGAVAVGKTNLDEFAMGSSTENSAFGTTRNPWDPSRVPGGSSGGTAAAVAAGLVATGLGSDTGGSIRQPASLCGVVGIKPTYGLVSRYGLIAFASSLDQIGTFAPSVLDAAAALEVIAGHDPADSTSIAVPAPSLVAGLGDGVEGLRVGLISDFLNDVSPACSKAADEAGEALAAAGAKVETVSIPEMLLGLPAYYIIAPAEASSNLARYDGVRYGMRVDGSDAETMNARTRAAGFGAEVRRRVMIGTYALSAGYYDAYYGQALRARTLMIRAFDSAYADFDVLLAPTTPSSAFKIGEKTAKPIEMYLSDLCTIPSNLSGHPAVTVPFALDSLGLPIGVQVLAPALGEAVMLRAAAAIEAAAPAGVRGPITPRTGTTGA
ncbi:MAG: Asp-tRNA(Asn)/Glu-tRNA(Gln) amidotransferase subunit GatA [Acidimicrobiales bacterium]